MSWQHIEDKTIKARKPHVCYLCCQTIATGEIYLRRFGYGEEGPETFRFHPECEEETRDWDDGDWETFCPGDFERPVKEASNEQT